MIWLSKQRKHRGLAPPPQIEVPEEFHGPEGERRAFGEDQPEREDERAEAAGDAPASKSVPIEEWVPHPISDSSEYLKRRRGPWPKWTPPARD